ncbi:hypothetical protein [Bacillus mycoides]|uniref:hypothetical protein n=1 Tax=Bacillus mycoides TaxID=1405 RepID=UPI003A800FB4
MYQKQRDYVRKRDGSSAPSVNCGLTGSGVHMGHVVMAVDCATGVQQNVPKRY